MLRSKGVKSFLDLLCLAVLCEGEASAYEVMALVYYRFGVLLSPGTVYPHISHLEKVGLIRRVSPERKTVYTLTDKGNLALQSWLKEFDETVNDFQSFLSGVRGKGVVRRTC